MKLKLNGKLITIRRILLVFALTIVVGFILFVTVPQIRIQYHLWMIFLNNDSPDLLSSSRHIDKLSFYPRYSMPHIKKWFGSPLYLPVALRVLNAMRDEEVRSYLNANPSERKEWEEILLYYSKCGDSGTRVSALQELHTIKEKDVVKDARITLRYDGSGLVKDTAVMLLILCNDNEKNIIPSLIEILEICVSIDANDISNLCRLQGDRMVVVHWDKDKYEVNKHYAERWLKNIGAQKYLIKMIGVLNDCNIDEGIDKQKIERLKQWWDENNQYLYWSNKANHFVIDEEAKATGIPTEEYRKTHPWPKDK